MSFTSVSSHAWCCSLEVFFFSILVFDFRNPAKTLPETFELDRSLITEIVCMGQSSRLSPIIGSLFALVEIGIFGFDLILTLLNDVSDRSLSLINSMSVNS